MSVAPIQSVSPAFEPPGLAPLGLDPALAAKAQHASPGASFAQMLVGGLDKVNQDIQAADAMAQAFALDDSIPLHQVTYALEHARLSVELMMQVRSRLLEGYQELLRMQL